MVAYDSVRFKQGELLNVPGIGPSSEVRARDGQGHELWRITRADDSGVVVLQDTQTGEIYEISLAVVAMMKRAKPQLQAQAVKAAK